MKLTKAASDLLSERERQRQKWGDAHDGYRAERSPAPRCAYSPKPYTHNRYSQNDSSSA